MATRHTEQQQRLAAGLAGLLADTYVVYNSTQCGHWNIEGPQFQPLHELFENQYGELAEAIDVIAERIRALGFYAPGTLPELLEMSRVQQRPGQRDADSILLHLIESHQQVAHRLRELQGLAEAEMDEATLDVLVERLRSHEKTVWMLKSQAGVASEVLSGRPPLRAAAS